MAVAVVAMAAAAAAAAVVVVVVVVVSTVVGIPVLDHRRRNRHHVRVERVQRLRPVQNLNRWAVACDGGFVARYSVAWRGMTWHGMAWRRWHGMARVVKGSKLRLAELL